MVQIATPAQTTSMVEQAQAEQAAEQQAANNAAEPSELISAIAAHINACFYEADRAKLIEMNERLLNCQRLRRGQYSQVERQEIERQGGSDIFVNLTNIKCRAAESWIKDIVLADGSEKPWTLECSPIPDLPAELQVEVTKIVAQEEAIIKAQGAEVHPDAFDMRKAEIEQEIITELQEVAEQRVRNMEQLIDTQLKNGRFLDAFRALVADFCTYPAAFLKGPVIRKRKTLEWGPNGPVVIEKMVREFDRVSPFDAYPAPDSISINDSYFIQRHRLFTRDLEAMRGVPGYKEDEIDTVIDRYGTTGYAVVRPVDAERDRLENRPMGVINSRSTIEALQFWGPVPGKILKEWAGQDVETLGFANLDDNATYEIEAWLVAGSHVIKAVLNPDPLGRRPIHKASWDDVPGSFWGESVPEIMGDVQRMINACARAMANNFAIASGPQVEVDVSRLPPGTTGIEEMYPWKVWQTSADRSGGGRPAVSFFQPASHAGELMQTMDWFYRKADEVTGIPNYTYGSGAAGGAGRTASGLSMLMENASKGIRQAIANLDSVLRDVISYLYEQNMLFEEDDSIKGDCNVVARGAMGVMAREALQSRRNEFLQATMNPIDSQIMGPTGRAYLLRQLAQGLQMDVNKIIPDPDRLKAMAQAQAAQAANQPPPPPPPDPVEEARQTTLINVAGEIVSAQIKEGQSTPGLEQTINAIEGAAASLASPQPPAGPQGHPPGPQGPPGMPPGQPTQ